ncbi:MAG: RNA-binding S4 domain-containing protein [Sphingomonadaceae bacterium]|jgi:ribosome-associated heat shock protein Hsp15|nr:RNA-binding S4 domain-containing protein [Sphingomonadaceae bacterium]MCB2085266.1 RNA-binding S4 domain-containing protein [Sphingomonadaceae bacterium]MCP5384866.1 RNA-binding S4 domain-containing protein [Altererythrobacter sp.]MCP5390538.1 RNA-binding S4 domain-containing protein [Sphingomonadaceae bacterium]MCP5392733.1 RNA-binding S4 domain-containing protein [Sphingomonadaceae bacterium]
MRIDLLLYRCRFARSRSLAQQLVAKGHIRCNGQRVGRMSHAVEAGDVLTLALGSRIAIVELVTLPERRGPASEAAECYRVLDRQGETALAAGNTAPAEGNSPP